MKYSISASRTACRSALIEAAASINPNAVLDQKGYFGDASLNLLPGVQLSDFEADLRQGDGNELEGKFRAAHSSSALAVNAFAPFKSDLTALWLPNGDRFRSLNFERKCHHGIAGRRSPNLDLVVDGPDNVVAIESKCLEFLSPHTAKFAPAYQTAINDNRRRTAWYDELLRLVDDPKRYRWLDVAQLIKHALGIMHTFEQKPSTLLYLFWEPANPEEFSIFSEHRNEIDRFKEAISCDALSFRAMSYPELWDEWETSANNAWIRDHVEQLRKRYQVVV